MAYKYIKIHQKHFSCVYKEILLRCKASSVNATTKGTQGGQRAANTNLRGNHLSQFTRSLRPTT